MSPLQGYNHSGQSTRTLNESTLSSSEKDLETRTSYVCDCCSNQSRDVVCLPPLSLSDTPNQQTCLCCEVKLNLSRDLYLLWELAWLLFSSLFMEMFSHVIRLSMLFLSLLRLPVCLLIVLCYWTGLEQSRLLLMDSQSESSLVLNGMFSKSRTQCWHNVIVYYTYLFVSPQYLSSPYILLRHLLYGPP